MLCLLVFFPLREIGALFCHVPLSWATEMAVKLRWVSWIRSVLGMISVIILVVGGGLLRSLIWLLSLALQRCGLYDWFIARVPVALLRLVDIS